MKRILLISVILAAILLNACAAPVTISPTPTPTPASFTVSALTVVPDTCKVGESVRVSATVTNTGGSKGVYDVVFKVNGTEEARLKVTLDPGGSQKVSYTLKKAVAGTYSVDVNGLTTSFVVTPMPVNWAGMILKLEDLPTGWYQYMYRESEGSIAIGFVNERIGIPSMQQIRAVNVISVYSDKDGAIKELKTRKLKFSAEPQTVTREVNFGDEGYFYARGYADNHIDFRKGRYFIEIGYFGYPLEAIPLQEKIDFLSSLAQRVDARIHE